MYCAVARQVKEGHFKKKLRCTANFDIIDKHIRWMHLAKCDRQFRLIAAAVMAYWEDVLEESAFAKYFESVYVNGHWGHWHINASRNFSYGELADSSSDSEDDADDDADGDSGSMPRLSFRNARSKARMQLIAPPPSTSVEGAADDADDADDAREDADQGAGDDADQGAGDDDAGEGSGDADADQSGVAQSGVPSVLARFLLKAVRAIHVNQNGIESGHRPIKLALGGKELRATTSEYCTKSLPKIARAHCRRITKHLKKKGYSASYLGDSPLDPDHIRIAHDLVTSASPGFLRVPPGELEDAPDVVHYAINDGVIGKPTMNMADARMKNFVRTVKGKEPSRLSNTDHEARLSKLRTITHGCDLVTVITVPKAEQQNAFLR